MKNLILFLLFAATTPLSAQVAVLEIQAGNHDRYQTPVQIRVNKPLTPTKAYYLQKPGSKKKLPAQAVDATTLYFILDSLPAGSKVVYHLSTGQAATPAKNALRIEKKPEGIQVRVGEKPVFFYQAQEALPANTPSHYSRSGFIHPLYSPEGQVLTDDFPVGHTHQHALFAAWVNTTFRNSFVDFWNQHLKKGTIEHVRVLDTQQGPVAARLQTELRYKSLEFGEVLRETWTVTVYPFTDYFLFDIEQQQTNTSKDTLHINKYTYGGMAFRGSREWNRTDSAHYTNRWQILTDQNKSLADANHTHARWVDASGVVDGKMTGLTVFGFPSNYRYPQAIRVHPDMPYWCYSPMVDEAFYIAPGGSYQGKYRYYVHNGAPDQQIIRQIDQAITDPIVVNVINR
ncbi:PmoA family protein [Telluribacter sp. SYSU D00476]|uniref:DUF6807 domain-containing protein n=1 Tax=Telluribacter sp. SYSU D00476 TaxID=2811430 RepID=UPI001FF5765B|nr:PmoA family protein [Telluribacter sp. SYSU D00476]